MSVPVLHGGPLDGATAKGATQEHIALYFGDGSRMARYDRATTGHYHFHSTFDPDEAEKVDGFGNPVKR